MTGVAKEDYLAAWMDPSAEGVEIAHLPFQELKIVSMAQEVLD